MPTNEVKSSEQTTAKRKKAKQELELSYQTLIEILDSIQDAFYVLDYDWNLVYANRQTATAVGKDLRDIVGQNFWKNLPKLVGTVLEENFRWVMEKREIRRFETDGKYSGVWYNVTVYPSAEGITVLGSDITEQKKAEDAIKASEIRFRSIFDNSLEGVLITSPDGSIHRANSAAQRMFGMTEVEIQKAGRRGTVVADERLSQAVKEREEKGKTTVELTMKRKDGSTFPVEMTSNLFVDADGTIKTGMIIRDITERKMAESKLKEYQNNLERLVVERTKQLKDSERLAAIGATAGMVGHDIRNPLQAITGDLFLAKAGLESCSNSEVKKEALESLMEIEKNIDYINKIVQDLQDYARPLNPNSGEANLKLIIYKLLEKNDIPANIKVSVKLEPDAQKIVADSDYLNRILYNLVINAVQAMPKGGQLTIHTYKEAKDVLIIIKDTGVGIPESAKAKLFTPMFTTKSKGQGFGLPVVKRVIETLGGTVTFESEEGKGTTFTVRLPTPKN